MSFAISETARAALSDIVDAIERGENVYEMYLLSRTNNAIIEALDAAGLDGYWFTFGPYLGWYAGPNRGHWPVLDRETRRVEPKGKRFVEALRLMLAGDAAGLAALWERVAGAKS